MLGLNLTLSQISDWVPANNIQTIKGDDER